MNANEATREIDAINEFKTELSALIQCETLETGAIVKYTTIYLSTRLIIISYAN